MTLLPRTLATLAITLALAIALAACSKAPDDKAKNGQAARKRVVPVLLDTVRHGEVPVLLRATGTVEASAAVAIKAQVAGIVQGIHFQEGDEVKAGAPLFTLDKRPFAAALHQAQGVLARDRAELDNARREEARYSAASRKGYVSGEQAEQAATRVATLTATVQADEAAVENARLRLEFCTIHAPISGRTGEVQTAVGNLVKENADTPLVTIRLTRPIEVAFAVPGRHLADIVSSRQAGSLRVTIDDPAFPLLAGSLSFLDNTIDPATATLRLKARFVNDDDSLWPGQTVAVAILLATRPAAILVPTRAINMGQKGPRVFVVSDEGVASERAIVAGQPFGEMTVVESGLSAGEKVVGEGQLQVTDGARVEQRNGSPDRERAKP